MILKSLEIFLKSVNSTLDRRALNQSNQKKGKNLQKVMLYLQQDTF